MGIGASTFNIMVEACRSMAQFKQIHAYSIASGLIFKRKVIAKLFRFAAVSPFGDVLYAHRMFDQMPDRQVFFCNTLIRGYAQSSSPSYSVFLFNEMRRSCIEPDEFSFNFVIKARSKLKASEFLQMYVAMECDEIHSLVFKLGFHSHLLIQNSLIHLYATRGCPTASRKVFSETVGVNTISWSGLVLAHVKAGQLDIARRVFNAIPEKDIVSWTAMISGYAQGKYPAEALELFVELTDSGLKPDEVTLISVLSACKTSGNLEFGMRVHRYIEENGLGWMVSLSNTLIDFYGKCGCLDEAWAVFTRMRRRSLITWNVMISAFAEQGDINGGLWLFTCMLDSGLLPDSFTVLGLLRAHARRGLPDEGFELFDRMQREYNVEATVEHYGCLVGMLCEAGRFEDAYKFAMEIPIASKESIWRCLLHASRKAGNVEVEEWVLKCLLEGKPGDETYRALLHDIYCSKVCD